MAQLLVSVYRYDPRNVLILRDDSRNPQLLPTKQNILNGIQWLVSNPVHGSHLVFHFSGAWDAASCTWLTFCFQATACG